MKKIFYSLITLVSQLIFLTGTHAQTSWEAGYIITQGRDTLHGMIEYKDWAKSPEKILFRDIITKESKQYSASDLYGFTLTSQNEFYKSAYVKIYYPKALYFEPKNPVSQIDSLHTFLEIIVKNNSFFILKYLDRDERGRFFIENNSTLIQLKNIEYLVYKEGATFAVARSQYKNQLKELFSDCKELNTKHLRYSEGELKKLYNRYLKCVGKPRQFEIVTNHKLPVKLHLNTALNSIGSTTAFSLGFALQHEIDKKFSNRFVNLSINCLFLDFNKYKLTDGEKKPGRLLYVYGYAGTYFGHNRWRPFIFTGLSNVFGGLDTGTGLSYNKRISIMVHSGLIDLIKGDVLFSMEARFSFSKK